VENGKLAVEARMNADYDLILMDIQMPVMDGITAAGKIREWEKKCSATRTPIIALTAHATHAHRQQCISYGMDDFLTKPISKKQLLAVVDKWAGDKPSE